MSQTVTPNGNSYIFPDDFEGYLYFSKWPLLLADMLVEVENATSAAETATTKAEAANDSKEAAEQAALKASQWADGEGEVEPGRKSAATHAADAEGFRNEAEGFRDAAYLWGNAGEDAPVDDGTHIGFSAYHYAQKAAASAASIAGGPVASVNGATGVVTLTAADVGALPTAGGTMTGAVGDTVVDKGTIAAAGSVDFVVSAGNVQKVTFSGAATITFSGWPASGIEGSVVVKITNGSNLGATDLDGLNWALGDGTFSTTFADTEVTLGTYNEILVSSADAGTTKYGWVS